MKTIYITISFLILLISCNSKENKVIQDNNHESTLKHESPIDSVRLANDLANKPKLFLKFWRDMTKREFDTVVKILIRENILQDDYGIIKYLVPKCGSYKLKPLFVKDSLRALELSAESCIYELYKAKYNLPNLIEEPLVEARYAEINTEYAPSLTYLSNEGEIKLPECFIDKSSYPTVISGCQKIPIVDDGGWTDDVLPKSPIVIKKENQVISFSQSFKRDEPSISYSLTHNPAMQKFITELGIFGRTDEIENAISRNSKYKIKDYHKFSVITVTYESEIDYNNRIQKEVKRTKLLQQEYNRQEKEKQERNRAVQNEL
ncbi:MAG: hypothetical protein JST78_08470 [Bacteroidetes bacterium]|nr:hypothetical protein [Bacteroidota bacterium]